ncbi:MAG TPA: hypothetical protein VMQ76_12275 [Terracidiphilus sp.]|jgi:hypothetical protein|nr:hypothetical protein [Terracidiphilus sp.]
MEITCNRCHQAVLAENSYCPACGLPQLLYGADAPAAGQTQLERWGETVRDAGSVDWKPALRAALLLAIPAGALSFGLSVVGLLGFVWMAVAGAWAVAIYMRSQRPAWITIGAGARIGLVTGLLGAWAAAATMSVSLFAMRFFFHQGKVFDDFWQIQMTEKASQQWAASGIDAQTILVTKALLNSPEGRGGVTFGIMLFLVLALVIFATAGGALGARLMGRTRQPVV